VIKALITSLLITFIVTGCGSSAPTRPTALQDLASRFPEVEAPAEIEPLEIVVVPAPEPPDATQARTYRLLDGQLAPINGILFTDAASAYIVSEYIAIRERFELALSQQRSRDMARLIRDTDSLRLQINGDRERFRLLLESQGRYIQDLEQLANRDTTFTDVLLMVGIGAIGAVVGVVVGFALAALN